jgi:Xaa-Pro dipeptidase
MNHPPAEAEPLFDAHLDLVLERFEQGLAACSLDALVVDAGGPGVWFLDDIASDWRVNPHFRLLTPCDPADGSSVLLRPGERPVLLHLVPEDFWHLPPAAPEGAWTRRFEIRTVRDASEREQVIGEWLGNLRAARIGPDAGLDGAVHNPSNLMTHLDYGRARKTEYEIACMRAANRRAAAGHRAAEVAFRGGESEFGIHLAYLAAADQEDADLPYRSIVALDRHGAVLHYQHRDRQSPTGGARSFLIDAGADAAGYAADVTRTHAREPGPFAELIAAMEAAQQDLVARIRPGLPWGDLHHQAHVAVACILAETGIATSDADTLLERGITRSFLPHGLGHLIGTQTHDAGGQLAGPDGTLAPPPEEYPTLRLTRTIEPDWVVTVEPGLYFIPMLLDRLRDGPDAGLLDWKRIEELAPFGGIRIEDDVRVTTTGPENLTRDAFREDPA